MKKNKKSVKIKSNAYEMHIHSFKSENNKSEITYPILKFFFETIYKIFKIFHTNRNSY